MLLDKAELQSIARVLKTADRILIISHKSPDGDTMGSALGLYHSLKAIGKLPTVTCIDPTPPDFAFMPGIEKYQIGIDHLDYDMIFIVDCGAIHLTGLNEKFPKLFDKSLEVVNIDHHPTNTAYGKYNLVVDSAAAATMIVYQMLVDLNMPLSRQSATCLLAGLYTDTGSFMHSNTDSIAMRIGARLLAKGADLRSISKEIFNTTKISTMHLWGRVLKNTYQTPEGVTMSVVSKKDFQETGADYSEMAGVVDYVNSVPHSKYSVILTERDEVVKGSLRTLNDDVDVCAIASEYGGGGHVKAAGFTVKGRLEKEVRWKVVKDEV